MPSPNEQKVLDNLKESLLPVRCYTRMELEVLALFAALDVRAWQWISRKRGISRRKRLSLGLFVFSGNYKDGIPIINGSGYPMCFRRPSWLPWWKEKYSHRGYICTRQYVAGEYVFTPIEALA
jgi:hypothetical protein